VLVPPKIVRGIGPQSALTRGLVNSVAWFSRQSWEWTLESIDTRRLPSSEGHTIKRFLTAKVTITYADARRGQVVLDVNASEVEEWASKGTRQARRGRRPKVTEGGA
jgi:hypothetical protein